MTPARAQRVPTAHLASINGRVQVVAVAAVPHIALAALAAMVGSLVAAAVAVGLHKTAQAPVARAATAATVLLWS